MMCKRYIFLLTCFFLFSGLNAKRAPSNRVKMSPYYKAANKAIKESNRQAEAQKALLEMLPQLTNNREKAKVYYYAALLDESLNGVENRNAYLRQKYDTAALFNHLLHMYEKCDQCDSVDIIPNKNGHSNPKYAKKTSALRKKHAKNMYSAITFFLDKKDYAQTYKFIDKYYTSFYDFQKPIFPHLAYQATLCAYYCEDHLSTLKYIDSAIEYAAYEEKPILQEYKCKTYEALNNDSARVSELAKGVNRFPYVDYFFVNLVEWYKNQKMIDEGMNLADSLIIICGSRPIYWYAKSKLMLTANNYEKCIEYSDSTIHLDNNYLEAHYNQAISYLNLAVIFQESACQDIKDPQFQLDRQHIQHLYQQARPNAEFLRKANPENPSQWAPLLYRIYLNLNMGKEFDEIEKILNEKESQSEKKEQEKSPQS